MAKRIFLRPPAGAALGEAPLDAVGGGDQPPRPSTVIHGGVDALGPQDFPGSVGTLIVPSRIFCLYASTWSTMSWLISSGLLVA